MVISYGRKHLINIERPLFYVDSFTMAWYVLAGASKSWFAEAGAVMSVILGSLTAVGGGALRDICVGEVPRLFKPNTYYGISSVVGAILYVVPVEFGVSQEIASTLCVGVGFALTVLSAHFGWQTRGGEPVVRHGKRKK